MLEIIIILNSRILKSLFYRIYLYVSLKNNVVIKKKVNENARKAAKSTWMMDYVKSNDWILLIQPWQNERQRSINNPWSCILGYYVGDRLPIVINEVLAAFIGKRESDTLPAPS